MDARTTANNGGLTEDRPDIGFKSNKRGYGPSVLEWQRRFQDEAQQQTFDWDGE
jgi:hypothetical protein